MQNAFGRERFNLLDFTIVRSLIASNCNHVGLVLRVVSPTAMQLVGKRTARSGPARAGLLLQALTSGIRSIYGNFRKATVRVRQPPSLQAQEEYAEYAGPGPVYSAAVSPFPRYRREEQLSRPVLLLYCTAEYSTIITVL